MYRAEGATSEELWAICAQHVDDVAAKRIATARGTCPASAIVDEGLAFDPDGKPHERHANVIGWPAPESKDKLKNIQQRIAAAMALEMRPTAERK